MTNENKFSTLIKEQLAKEKTSKNIGEVIKVGDGVAKISGLSKVGLNELVYFEKANEYGIAFNIESDSVGVVVLGEDQKIGEGDIVTTTGTQPQIQVGKQLAGRVVNAMGSAIDAEGILISDTKYNIERKAPGVLDRKPVDRPLQTGIKVIDAVIPVGRGQRELIIGDRKTGKTSVIADTIISQSRINKKILNKESDGKIVYSIYCAIGQKASSVASFITHLKKENAFDQTIIVYASPDESPAMQYLAPYSATAIGEYFMDNGMDAVVFYDDLTKHAWAYRQMSLLLNRFPGREAYPGDIFYLHSRLLERSSQLSDELGGGSLTAFPVIETLEGDVSAYIPTNVISITDGQIYLDTDLFNSDIKPAVNAGTSVSRVGTSAQVKGMKKLSGKLRLILAQYRELAAFAQFGSDLDKETLKKLERGKRLTEILNQKPYSPMEVEKQIAVLFAITNGYLDQIEVSKVKQWESDLLSYLEISEPDILSSIKKEKDIDEKTSEKLKKILSSFIPSNI